MKNFVQPGNIVTATAPTGGVSGGDGVLISNLFGVAATDAAEGADVELQVVGVFDLAKVSAEAWTQWAAIYWDDTAKKCTTTSTDNTKIGIAILSAVNPSAVGRVRLNGSF